MVLPPPVEPDSPLMNYEEDDSPELGDGLRNLSVSTDGTIDSLISQDENPTPPHSPLPSEPPVFHISPPGASSYTMGPRVLDFGEEDHPMHGDLFTAQKELASGPQTPIALATPVAPTDVPFFGAAVPITPPGFKPELGVAGNLAGNLAARRAASGKLPSKALLSLQQMRFESSRDAGMGLGVGPPSSGLEGISPGGPGFTFQAAMGLHDKSGSRSSSPLPSPGVENIALDSPSLGAPAPIRWGSPQNGNKLPRSPGGIPSLSSEAFKPSLRGTNLRINLSAAGMSPSSSPLPSPSGERPPSSPLIKRTSAFHISNTGPRTPLTPSHLPGAPTLGAGGPAFEWFAFSMPDSPGCPAPPPGAQVAERSCYFSDLTPASPTSSNGTYLPTPGSERGRTPYGMQHRTIPASPLGQGRFAASQNPFFA
ncbi:hypothetical protein JCM8547_007955 [Rhodosporidiobolus lusitaniae]